MGTFSEIVTIASWEVRRSFSTMGRNVLPLAILLFVLLVAATGFVARSGMHLQDGMYTIATDDADLGAILASDGRFAVSVRDGGALAATRYSWDLVIVGGVVSEPITDRGRAAAKALARDYSGYVASVYNREPDLFAAYPLWIDLQYVKSELDFQATQGGQYISVRQRSSAPPVPSEPVVQVTPPPGTLPYTADELRTVLQRDAGKSDQVSRYTNLFTQLPSNSNLKTPSQLSPTLPFDSIIFVFVFIFPLYFTSQFFMMSVMNERIERKGEILLSGPLHPLVIIAGKMLPYLAGMLITSLGVILAARASLLVLLPLAPVILFFLASALLIGMLCRSFKELSFVSIFFSTVATAYLFFPSIFANVHVISLVSPLTLIILQVQGTGFTAMDYLYSTTLFYVASGVLLYIGAVNFNAERLFDLRPFLPRLREFVASSLSREHPYRSLFLANLLLIPFVFMLQMMALVLFFNLPMPLSLVLLMLFAALVEEMAKSLGVYSLFYREFPGLPLKTALLASAATALGFLAGEKLFLLFMLSQITESVFGSILFLQQGALLLWMPLVLHFAGVLLVTLALSRGGRRWYVPGILSATAVHCLYNLSIIMGMLR
ncbi:MAG TPA: ABC transporter permease [Methanomicrobiales archaeon]|jgi:ABC-type Na+ efflux pump permease subunit|nr:ABC transporter permease [Methanomicrobiales archaeon]